MVIVSRIDRMTSKDGGKVSALTINWELRAAGTTYDIAGAVQMDKVQTSDVAGVVSSHEGFGSGAFASRGLDADSPCAVIPFFNRTEELLSASNTWKGQPAAAIRKHTTTVTFSQPVDIASVLDSEMNFFIAPKQRTSEIHMPGYAPTASGIIGKGSFLPSDPYKFFVTEGDQTKNNYMMWALMIPASSATLPRRTTSAASTNTSWHGPRPTARSTRSGIWRAPMPVGILLRKRPVMGRGCERFAAFFASGRCRRTEGCAGIEDGRAVRGLPQARGPQALKLRGNPRLRFAEVCGPRASGGHVVSRA